MFGSDFDSGEDYLYHYTSSTTLARILDSGTLRFGPYVQTNDPRETGEWLAGMSMAADYEEVHGPLDYLAVARQLDVALRHRTRLACLTMDREPSETWPFNAFHRGWARARMWSQYGDRHQGACLMFHRAALDQAVTSAMSAVSLFAQPVRYSDDPDPAAQLHVSVEEVMTRGVAEVADEIIATRGGDLFFQKNTDWTTESEFRYVVVGEGAPEFVDVRGALAAVVVGVDFPGHELSVIKTRLERLDLANLGVAQVIWMKGAPVLVPALPLAAATTDLTAP